MKKRKLIVDEFRETVLSFALNRQLEELHKIKNIDHDDETKEIEMIIDELKKMKF